MMEEVNNCIMLLIICFRNRLHLKSTDMKLLYITNGVTGSGGLERVLSVKASVLAEEFGYEVHLLSLNEIGKDTFFDFSEKVRKHGITVNGNPIQYFSQYQNGIQKVVDEVQPDLISVCDDALKGFFLPLIIKTKSKWVYESHASLLLNDSGSGIPFKKKIQHHLKQVLGKHFSKVILLTDGNKKEWQLKNVVVIPNPAPFETSQLATLRHKKIIAVGSYSFNKGYDLLIKIWAKLELDFPEWELDVYGRETRKNLQPLAEKLNLKNIHFHEPVTDIGEKYVDSSIMVLPSRSEGFGMVLIEAMTFGIPAISFDCPNGPKNIISNGKDGFLIENGNTGEFAEKMKLLMLNENLRKEMGGNATQNVQRFSAKRVVDRWDVLFRGLV